MSRRTRFGSMVPEVRSSLGDSHVEAAVSAINVLGQRSMALMTEYRHTREATLQMLFSPDTLAKMSQVRGMVTASSYVGNYVIPGTDATMSINFAEALCPTIDAGMLALQEHKVGPLIECIHTMQAIHYQFEEIKGVLRWLNRNATLGAIRYNWPTAMKLCPNSPIRDMEGVPSRFHNPPNIGDWMQMLKDSATTFAGTLLLPDSATKRNRTTMWLTFPTKTVTNGLNSATYVSDNIIYNL